MSLKQTSNHTNTPLVVESKTIYSVPSKVDSELCEPVLLTLTKYLPSTFVRPLRRFVPRNQGSVTPTLSPNSPIHHPSPHMRVPMPQSPHSTPSSHLPYPLWPPTHSPLPVPSP